MVYPRKTFSRFTATATDDNTFRVIGNDLFMHGVDIFVFDNDCYFGDATNQDINISAGDVYSLDHPINLAELIFKNYTASSNTRIVLSGKLMNEEEKSRWGLI